MRLNSGKVMLTCFSYVMTGILLVGCGHQQATTISVINGGTTSLSSVESLAAVEQVRSPFNVSTMRVHQLQEAAMSIAAQSALSWRTKQINAVLSRQEKKLDRIFNFTGMLLEQNVLPPVLLEGRDVLHLSSPDSIRLADRVFEIKTQAHFVTMPPTWRDYLSMDYAVPEKPDASLLPRSKKESAIWREASQLGWQQGLAQAEDIYHDNLARLKEDYTGMALYRKLLAEHMVSRPFVARTGLGVTGDSNHVRVNDAVLRITALPQMLPNSPQWNPVVKDDN